MVVSRKKLLVIDTDPGVDDAMAILAAFNSPDVEIVGMTTLFGNVRTPQATANAIVLRELAGRQDVPVAQGSLHGLNGQIKQRVADFVHGSDGFGNLEQAMLPSGTAVAESAATFLVELAARLPGQITLLALAPLTNVAEAMQLDPNFAANLAELVVLGGAFFTNGNVNPAAEANIFGDPEAADVVFSSQAKMRVVGLDVTHSVRITGQQLTSLRTCGRFGDFLQSISVFYLKYHTESYGMDAIYVHDPTAMAAVLAPELFGWEEGQMCVVVDGFARGQTILDRNLKEWNAPSAWTGKPKVKVATSVQSEGVAHLMYDLMAADGPPADSDTPAQGHLTHSSQNGINVE